MTTSAESLNAAGSTPVADDRPRATKKVVFGLIVGNFGLWLAFFTPVIISFPVKVGQLAPGGREVALSLVLAFASIFGIIANPIAGRLSDRSLSRFGRRRTWILGATLVGLVGLVVMGTAASVPAFTVGAVLGGVGFAGSLAVLLSLIPEHIPPRQQGAVAGLFGVAQAVAAVFGIVVGGMLQPVIALAFIVPGVLGLLAVLVLCALVPDPPISVADRPAFTAGQFWGSFWTSPRKHPDFGWAWFSRFGIFMAFAAVANYQVYYLNTQLRIPIDRTTQLIGLSTAIQTVALIVTSIVFGRISDRIGRRKPFIFLSSALGAVGLLVLAFNTTVPGFLLSLGIIGLAQGVYYSVDLAMVAQLLPNKERDAAKDFGVFSIASNLPQTLAPVIAPAFLAIGVGSVVAGGANYTALFIGSAFFAVIAAVTALPIRGVR